MSKSEGKHPYNFGRVFFPGEPNAIPEEVRFQPLGNHVGNVIKLVRLWDKNNFPCDSSFDRVVDAAKIHDKGKPQKFELQVKTDSQGKFKKYIYSFKGHRFLAESKDAWAQALARGHHDFSVGDISRDAYILKKDDRYADILQKDPLAYARELYILEMCDQIEAELACRIIGDEEQAESRTFMDYTIAPHPTDKTVYYIDPWPFSSDEESIELTFESWLMRLSEETRNQLQKCQQQNGDADLGKTLDKIAKDWWRAQQGKPESQPSLKATIKPYLSSIDADKTGNCRFWYEQLAGFVPNPMQEEIFEAIARPNPAILFKAPTGSGKMEAILFPALAQKYRLFLPLPARSLLDDQKQRIETYLKKFSRMHPEREVSLVVDTGAQMYRWVYRNGDEIKLSINPWRHLYKGDVILTTLDKFIYRYFAFGYKKKSFTFPIRIHGENTLICFDEAHSYEDISYTNFQGLVQSIYEAGRSLVLMTATMPSELADRFDYLTKIDYIDDGDRREALERFQRDNLNQPHLNQRRFEWISHLDRDSEKPEKFQDEVAQIVLKEWQVKPNRRMIAVVETVKDAAAIYKHLKSQLNLNTVTDEKVLFLYHGRLADKIRPEIYKQIKERDEAKNPYLLITTSAIEVGCDLNCEVLISQICPPENLIQRVGRCNRKGQIADAKIIVVGDRIPDFANTLDELGWQIYQKTLRSLKCFDTQAISQCIARSQHIDDYRVVELFSMLHEYVYDANLTYKPVHEKGLVITRSWTPSATLIYDDGTSDPPQISVPINRLVKNYTNQYANTHVYERFYDPESTHRTERALRWGSAYSKDIVIKIARTNVGAEMPDGKPDYPYECDLGFVELPGVFIKLRTSDFDEKLLCQHDKQKSAIITYVKSLNEKRETR